MSFSCGILAATILFHADLSFAIVTISCSERWQGTSMKRFASLPIEYCLIAARYKSLWGPIRSICPSHLARVRRTAATRSNVRVRALASSCIDLPVILLKHLEFAPFSAALVRSSKFQASLPYVKSEQTAARYTFNFSDMGSFELNTCLMRSIASPIRRRTSYF